MATLKMSGCMKLISKMSEADQDALLQRLDQYEADGVPRERAQTMAAQDMLAEIQGERDSLFSLLQEQHPELFTVSEEPAAAAQMSRRRNPELVAQADAIAAMDPDTRDNMEIGQFAGGGDAYNLYEARKLLKKPSDKLKRVTENNTFSLWTEYEFVANVDGELIGVNKDEDPDDVDDDMKFVYAYQRLEDPRGPRVVTTTDQVDELFKDVRTRGAQMSRRRSPLGFYSALADSVDGIKTNSAPAQGWKDAIKGLVNKGQVKADEVEWSGVNDWLDLQQGKVTKQQVADYLEQGGVQVEETVLGKPQMTADGLPIGYEIVDEGDGRWSFSSPSMSSRLFRSRDEAVAAAKRDAEIELESGEMAADQPRYGQYTLPGGENYREVLLTLPVSAKNAAGMAQADRIREEAAGLAKQAMAAWTERGDQAEFDRLNNQSRDLYRQAGEVEKAAGTETYKYESKHWDQPNVLAHIRVNDRTDADGKRVLFVEELQSDWGQEGKKQGFGGKNVRALSQQERERLATLEQRDMNGFTLTSEERTEREALAARRSEVISGNIPAAPFVTKTEGWLNLALKRVMVMAAEGGYDTVAFVNGEQSADRYDLSKQVSRVTLQREQYAEDSYGPWVLSAEDKGGRNALDKELGKPEDAEEYIGKEVTQRLIEKLNGGNYSELSGLDLKVGGEGMKAFYDTIVPTALKKLLPKVGGGQMSEVAFKRLVPALGFDGAYGMQPGFDVTPAMREKVAEGVPLFSTRRNIYGDQLLANWTMPTDSKLLGLDKDSLIYRLQDKQIDLKRVIEGVTAATGQIDEKWNAYLKEELYHGRTAKATKDFIGDELRPLLQGMDRAGVSMADFETYLHNRHAEERNIQIAKINPAMPDGGSGIDTADARSYLAGLDPAKRQAMESLAKRVDAITKETRELLVRSGLETRETIDKWEAAYGKYVPLIREDLDFSADLSGSGTGQGYSVRGPSSKRATGSKREVVDIMANLAMQRERAIVRAEKARVGTALYGLALKNPNPDFWLAVNPDAIKDPKALMRELEAMGLDPLAAKSIAEEPKQPYPDPKTGLVSYRINAQLRGRDNVFAVRINGQDRFLFFNTKDERAARMVSSLKNLDADQLGAVMGGVIAPVTRWFASVNTQYNPVFGAVNLIRDTEGALVNLSTTDIADRKAQVFRGIPGAMAGIYSDLRKERKGGQAQGEWAALWEEFQKAGGQTGFRDMFKTAEDRTKALQAVMDPSSWADSKLGKVFTAGGALKMPLEAARKYAGAPLFDWLSDYNETLENAVRLSAYKAAKDKGLSTEKAASIAKNLTVNFNRKGQVATQMGALWAFFNAAVQGSARLYDTLTGPAGRKIMAGGLLLGTLQAVSLALMGFDEDEPPEFVKERNLVVPLGTGGKYIQIPMALGLHVIPSTSRIITEWIMSGFKDTTKRVTSLANLYLEAFNPVGNAATLIQTLSPTFADPLVALAENKDWQGRPIYKEDRSGTDPTPGYTRARDTATWFSKELAYYLNLIGGTKYTRGVFSPTPDQIDYLFAQAGGGVVREAQKISQAVQSSVTGEELPSYKIPLGGRFYGDIKEQSAVQSRFYDNLKKLNEHEREIEGRRKNREGGIQEYLRDNPEARLANIADRTEREVQELRRRRREMIERGRPKESIKMIEAQITRKMQQLNDRVEKLEEATVP